MKQFLITTSQTIGPFPHEGWRWAFETEAPQGAVVISGRVLDGSDAPISDALLEAYSPILAEQGEEVRPSRLPGLQRVPSDDEGRFRFVLPQRPAPGEPVAFITVFARGLLQHQFTAVLLADDPALEHSSLLAPVPQDRRQTLLAQPVEGGYHWDLRFQGDRETVFFDYE